MKPAATDRTVHNAQPSGRFPDPECLRLPGLTPYAEAYALQRERRDAVERGDAPEAVYLLEHAPVFTLGRNAHAEHLLRSRDDLARVGIEVVETDRGGDITYHGPGQLVAYPILRTEARGFSVRGYLRFLEGVLIAQLAQYGLDGERVEGYTGVWAGGAKVAAIGVGVHRGVSFHGIALNVAPNLEHFQWIVPCGIPDKPVGTLAALLASPPSVDRAALDFYAILSSRLRSVPEAECSA